MKIILLIIYKAFILTLHLSSTLYKHASYKPYQQMIAIEGESTWTFFPYLHFWVV